MWMWDNTFHTCVANLPFYTRRVYIEVSVGHLSEQGDHDMTPHIKYFGRKPHSLDVKVFGSFAHVPILEWDANFGKSVLVSYSNTEILHQSCLGVWLNAARYAPAISTPKVLGTDSKEEEKPLAITGRSDPESLTSKTMSEPEEPSILEALLFPRSLNEGTTKPKF